MDTLELADLKTRLNALLQPLTPDSPADDILNAIDKIGALGDALKLSKEQLDQILFDWLSKDNRQLVLGDKRWYIGTETKVTPKDYRGILETLLELSAGDLDALSEFLASKPFKHGSIKAKLNDEKRYHELFTVETVKDVATGKPLKSTKCVDDRFVTKTKK